MSSLAPPTLSETGRSLGGVFTVLEGDRRGFEAIDDSLAGTLRSFLVYFWCWPAQIFLWTGIWRDLPDSRPDSIAGAVGFLATGSIFDMLSWVVPALILYPVSGPFGFRKRYLRLIAVTNWYGLVATYLGFLPATVAYLAPVPQDIAMLMALVVYGLSLGLYFRLARFALDGEALIAGLVTLVMLMSSIIISSLAFSALGI